MSELRPAFVAVVDDEESIRKALTRLLRSAGMVTEAFPSGAEFLASIEVKRPDCVVLDLHMPGLSGFDVQDRLAESSPTVPVVIMTGQDSTEARDRALAAHAAAYLRKPVTGQSLFAAIKLALAQHPPA